MERYYQDNVDPTARPLAINVDYKDALMRCYDSLKDAIQGRKSLKIWDFWRERIIFPAVNILTGRRILPHRNPGRTGLHMHLG